MIISEKVSIHRIISGTRRHFIFNLAICTLTYLLAKFFILSNLEIPVLIPTVLGTALAFFIGFNNNQAYDRWWEARKIWGSLVNDSRTWARQSLIFPNREKNSKNIDAITHRLIYRHIAFVYALKQTLRKSDEDEFRKYISAEDLDFIGTASNKANALLILQTKDLSGLYGQNFIDGFKFIELNKMLTNFCDEMGMSERIANTVFPTSYNYYTRIFIWIFIVFDTLATAQSLGFWSILAGTLIGYVFLTSHKIGKSLLNPFEDVPSGIPLNHISRTIEINLLETLGEKNIPSPVEICDNEYLM